MDPVGPMEQPKLTMTDYALRQTGLSLLSSPLLIPLDVVDKITVIPTDVMEDKLTLLGTGSKELGW